MRKHAEKENGLHDLMEIMLESMMVAERGDFLQNAQLYGHHYSKSSISAWWSVSGHRSTSGLNVGWRAVIWCCSLTACTSGFTVSARYPIAKFYFCRAVYVLDTRRRNTEKASKRLCLEIFMKQILR